jgi:hypothetical protein
MAGRSVVDRETRSSILPVRTRYRFSSVVERGPPKPDVDCSIQSAGANVFSYLGGPLAGTQRATVVLQYEFALHHLAFVPIARSRDRAAQIAKEIAPAKLVGPFATAAAYDRREAFQLRVCFRRGGRSGRQMCERSGPCVAWTIVAVDIALHLERPFLSVLASSERLATAK